MIGRFLCFIRFHVPHSGVEPASCLWWECVRCKSMQPGGQRAVSR